MTDPLEINLESLDKFIDDLYKLALSLDRPCESSRRQAFARHLGKCAYALRILWCVRKGDQTNPVFDAAIMDCISRSDVLEIQIENLEREISLLQPEDETEES